MDMDMAEVFDFRFPSQCSTPLFAVVCFCCLFLLLSKPAELFASVCSVYGSYATAFLLVPLSSRLSLIRVCRQEPSLAILFSIFEGTLYEFEFSSCEQRNDIQKFFDICMIYGNAYANASAMVFYGRSNACLVAVDSKYSELWISLLQWK